MKAKNKIIYLLSFICVSLIVYFVFKEKNERENIKSEDVNLLKNENINNAQKNEVKKNETIAPKDVEDEINYNELSPHEYVAWLKNPKDRVLLEIKDDGARIFRKGNVTITVMPNGEELYLPDEL
ncbi:hypothetical protein [Fluviispira sanaruensis]|uniref:Uncharacterized protein n=1 Tax=Fluviispira sanaruensis TaxID=2493639 RepID=A0A4P2VY89_FLUSA|nr:hypothetical protein [Fluviispira sanaruensis]BBH54022.1 hypothetical protein JCM31447_24790 [Fluviispira sanaruensis]